MIIRCHNRITITEMILASSFSRHFHLFTSFFQQWRQKKVDSFERLRHGSPAPFYILWDFWKLIDKPLENIWENWAPVRPKSQNKIQRNQLRLSGWTNLTKSIINLPFTRKSVFGNFVNKQASPTPILTHQNYKAANPLTHAFSPSYWLMNTQRMAWNQLMYSEENRFQKHATWNISRIEVVSKNNWRKKDPIKTVQKDFMKLMMVAKERRVFLGGRKWNPARFDDAKLGPKNVMNYPTLALKTVMQGETLLKPIGITAKKAKSINFGPINFKSNNCAITKCSYHRIRFSLANFSARSTGIFCLS